MNELRFIGMDIVEETNIIVNFATSICTEGMIENELKAYQLGVSNVMSALKEILSIADKEFIVHVDGIEIQEEFDIVDLENYLCSI